MPETYTYKHIVIVHGMGEAAPNETALGFMNEFIRALPDGEGYSVDVFNFVQSVDDIKEAKEIEPTDEDAPLRPRRSFTPAYIIFKNGNTNHVIGFSEVYWKQIPDHYLEQNGGHLPIPISTWAHSINTRFMRGEIRSGGKKKSLKKNYDIHRRFRKINEVIDNVEKMLKILTRLAAIYKKSGELASVTRNYLGDVQMYAESDEIRQQINNRFLNVMSRIGLFSKETAEELKRRHGNEFRDFEEREIYVVAHSQGTVISYNSLVQAAMLIERTDKQREEFPGLFEREEKLIEEIKKEALERAKDKAGKKAGREAAEIAEKEAKAIDWLPKVKGLVTFGTPIDKFYTIWENRFRRDNLKNERPEKIPWFNFWDHSDPFAYGLKVLFTKEDRSDDPNTDAKKLFNIIDDRGFSRYFIPALAHTKYWKDEAIYKDIIYRVMKLSKEDNPPTAVKTRRRVQINRWLAYVGYFLGRIATLFFIVVFLNRFLYPLHKSWIRQSSEADSIGQWIFFVAAFIAPFAIIWALEEISFLCASLWEKFIKWVRKFFVVGWWVWAFILCIMLSPISEKFIEPFYENGKETIPTVTDRVGYLTSLVVLCLIWKLHTALHRGLVQMWQYTLGENTEHKEQAGQQSDDTVPSPSDQAARNCAQTRPAQWFDSARSAE